MTIELTFHEKTTTKLQLGAMFAARGFLESRGVQPNEEEATRIASEVAPIIDRLVRGAGIDDPDCDFAELLDRVAVVSIGVAAQVMNLAPRKPFAVN